VAVGILSKGFFSILRGQEEGRVVNQNDVLFVAADGPLNLHGG